ncbi:MAG: NifB/NifX family molybdenum-iron cluster-binding protein [Roseburia sp.]
MMAYKIAIGSSDGVHVDLKFGEVKEFRIYEINGEQIELLEIRPVNAGEEITEKADSGACKSSGCGDGGCGGNGTGCGGPSDVIDRVAAIADCRCVVCKKVGFQAQKQFEKKAISVFDVECEVQEALNRITYYYGKIDRHESFKAN